jgi:soluble lytic murein transglycosylase
LLAFALLQLGDSDRAAAELRLLWPKVVGTPVARAVMLVADRAGLSELAAQLADLLQAADGRPRDSLRFKIPRLQPDGGFSVDPAMVYGLARTESNFDAASASAAGALGIMQIMPDTAAFIIPRRPRGTPMRELLQDAGFNLALGQRYVTYLSTLESIDGDLIRLLAAYNCGPARLAQWSATLRHEGDPLLFIEAIPIDETRAFVPRVLAYTWLYARRLHLPTPSLDELAAGVWPRYHPLARQDESLAYLH